MPGAARPVLRNASRTSSARSDLPAIGPFEQHGRNADDQGSDQRVDANVFARQASVDMQYVTEKCCNQDSPHHDCNQIPQPKFSWIEHRPDPSHPQWHSTHLPLNVLDEESKCGAPLSRRGGGNRRAFFASRQREKVGGRYAADPSSQLPARLSGSAAFSCTQSGH
jgi:hypothetical protein